MSKFDPYYRSLSDFQKSLQRFFPQRQIILRTEEKMYTLRLTTIHQAVAFCCMIVLGGWVLVSSGLVVSHSDRIRAKEIQIKDARTGYEHLLAQLNVYNRRINEITDQLDKNGSLMVSLVDKQYDLLDQKIRLDDAGNNKKSRGSVNSDPVKKSDAQNRKKDTRAWISKSKQIDVAIGRLELDRLRVVDQREVLHSSLDELKSEMRDATNTHEKTDFINSKGLNNRRLNIELNLAASETLGLLTRVDQLEKELREMEGIQLMLFHRFSEVANEKIDHISTSLKSTGLEVDDLLSEMKKEYGSGGPFIPVDPIKKNIGPINESLVSLNSRVQKLTELENLLSIMPLKAPLTKAWITSGFGVRKDPFSGAYARHLGTDFGAAYNSEIFSPGSGKVSFAGWRGRYGRLIEINHGMNISSRYGHLAKILVKEGDFVTRETVIGLLGNSGRSTGPHLHFEILHNGKQLNPMKFLRVGNDVLKES